MPQVDLETLVSACGGATDNKIACETLAGDAVTDEPKPVSDVAPDVPPESFWLSKDAVHDWFDRNAFYERKESTKGGANSNSQAPNPNFNPSASQRSSVGLKSIIGLPKAQNTTYNSKWRTCRAVNIRLFPKRTASAVGKSTAVVEPGSPKVSCMGRVRSKRSKRRSNSVNRERKSSEKEEKTTSSPSSSSGFYAKVMSLFRSKKSGKRKLQSRKMEDVVVEDEVVEEIEPRRMSVSVAEPPGLGGMQRFASGRRSGSFTPEELNLPVSMGRS